VKFNLKDIEKMIQEFEPEPTGNEFLDQRFEESNCHPYYRFFYQFAKRFKPEVIVELGSWQGTSAAHFAGGSPESLVITIDHHTDPGDEENRLKTVWASNEFINMHYFQGWTCTQLYQEEKFNHFDVVSSKDAFPWIIKMLDNRKIDVLFIDSWHRYDQAKKDWEAYEPLLNSSSLVICDDILEGTPGSGIDNMVKFWEELPDEKFLNGNLHLGYPMGFLKWT